MRALSALAVCAFLLAACGSSDQDKIKDVVGSFEQSIKDKDGDKFCDSVTTTALEKKNDDQRAKLIERCKKAATAGQFGSFGKIESVKVEDVKVNGRNATAKIKATVNGKGTSDAVKFRKVDGDWKISLDGG